MDERDAAAVKREENGHYRFRCSPIKLASTGVKYIRHILLVQEMTNKRRGVGIMMRKKGNDGRGELWPQLSNKLGN